MKLSVVMPAHNEEENLPRAMSELQRNLRAANIPYELIVVNDNSTDRSAEIIDSFASQDNAIIRVERRPPAGFGRAIRDGLKKVTGDVIAIYMSDLSDDPRDLVSCYRKIQEGFDCVYGSRFIKGSKVVDYPIVKLIVNRLSNRLVQLLFWTHFNDLTNAFKVYRADVIKQCGPFVASHFNITIEMSLAPLIRKYRIVQIPIKWYGRTAGVSRLRLLNMSRRYLSTLLKVFFDSLLIKDDLIEEKEASKKYW